MIFKVDKFRRGDMAACVSLVRSAIGSEDSIQSEEHFKSYESGLVTPGEWLYVAKTFNRETIGVCGIFPVRQEELAGRKEWDICGLHWFAVDPSWQRRGIGSELLRWSEGMAGLMQFKSIFTQSDDRAISFYRGRGYRAVKNFLKNPMPYTTLLEKNL